MTDTKTNCLKKIAAKFKLQENYVLLLFGSCICSETAKMKSDVVRNTSGQTIR